MNIRNIKRGDIVHTDRGLKLVVERVWQAEWGLLKTDVVFYGLPYKFTFEENGKNWYGNKNQFNIIAIEAAPQNIDWQSLKTGNRLHSRSFGVVIFCSMNPVIAGEFLAMDENGKVNSYCSMDPEDGWELIND